MTIIDAADGDEDIDDMFYVENLLILFAINLIIIGLAYFGITQGEKASKGSPDDTFQVEEIELEKEKYKLINLTTKKNSM